MVVCVSMGRARRWGAEGVVEADGEVVREELLGGTELAMGSGNNRRRLPPVGCLRRSTSAGDLPLPGFASRCHGHIIGAGGAR
jgi:hypothetical protein